MKTPTLVRAAALVAALVVTLALAQSVASYALPPGPPAALLMAHASAASASGQAMR